MLIDPTFDGHVHTSLCHHATGTMEEYVLAGIRKELKTICFLEHLEVNVSAARVTWLSKEDFEYYFIEGQRLKKKYSNEIQVLLGVEVGYSTENRAQIIDQLSRHSWDQIGISCHFYKTSNSSHHLNLVSKRDDKLLGLGRPEAEDILRDYYTTLMDGVEHIPANVVCHIDGVLRYHPDITTMQIPWEVVIPLLEKIKKRGMAIEVNTSGIAIRGEVFPCSAIFEKATNMNIPFIAGSDAHSPDQVGGYFEELIKL